MGNHASRAAEMVGEDQLARPPLVLYTATLDSMSTVELKMWADQFKGLLDEESILFLYEKFLNVLAMSSLDEKEIMSEMKRNELTRLLSRLPNRNDSGNENGSDRAGAGMLAEDALEGEGAISPKPAVAGVPSFRTPQQVTTGILPDAFRQYMTSTGAFKGSSEIEGVAIWQRKRKPHPSTAISPSEFHSAPGVSADGRTTTLPPVDTNAHQFPLESVQSDPFAHLFRAFDADRDGIISFSDFLIFHAAMGYHTEEHLAGILFYAFDADGDHWISYNDLVTVITASTACVGDFNLTNPTVLQVIHAEAQRLMAFLDCYRTGRVSEETLYLVGQRHPEVLEKLRYLL